MIEVKNLVKRYGDHVAVKNLSFTVEEGQIPPVCRRDLAQTVPERQPS